MSPPVSEGSSGNLGPANERASRRSCSRTPWSRSGSAMGSPPRRRSLMATPRRSAVTTAAGSPAAKEYRPHRSDRSTLSSKIPAPSAARAGKTPTGVDTSASSSVQTGTSAHDEASSSNVFRSGRTFTPSASLFKTRSPGALPGASVESVCLDVLDAQRPRALRAPRPGPAVLPSRHRGGDCASSAGGRQRDRGGSWYPGTVSDTFTDHAHRPHACDDLDDEEVIRSGRRLGGHRGSGVRIDAYIGTRGGEGAGLVLALRRDPQDRTELAG